MEQNFQHFFQLNITIRELLTNVLVATCCGVMVAFFYIQSRRHEEGWRNSLNMGKSIIMLAMITSFVMMVIGDSLARAFGMVGLISLIRFRTNFKGAREFMFIFFALAIGLAVGVRLYAITLVATLLIGIIMWIITELHPPARKNDEYLLQITSSSFINEKELYEPVLDQFCGRFRLLDNNSIVNEKEIVMKISYNIMFKNKEDGNNLLTAFQSMQEVSETKLKFIKE